MSEHRNVNELVCERERERPSNVVLNIELIRDIPSQT